MERAPVGTQVGAGLDQSWCQENLSWPHVASEIATNWPAERRSRETAAFVVNLGSNSSQVRPTLPPDCMKLVPSRLGNRYKMANETAVSRDCRFVGQLVAILEATRRQLSPTWRQL